MKYFLAALLLLNVGCQQTPPDTPTCSSSFSLLDTNAIGENQYEHFVVLNGYEDACFSRVAFTKLARAYADTVRRNTPVLYVTFLRPASREFYDSHEPDIAGLLAYQIVKCRMDGRRVDQISIGAYGKEKTFSAENNTLIEQ
ncbi:hypothetical protein [Hymenobacter sp. CRA2]|uniref:hypothetical protein n=1 Tax=Hymenobacter sp. CRA2 TaxID=1955620 RepID=UPI0009901C94|nr:hypothetical protein [Hymenobacter sp. CRA2]OON70725.1 hypothetical protein B0919_01545 [Hymenobacter sp. CRA2]